MVPVQALTGAQCKERLVWKGLGSWRNIPLHGDTRGQGAAPRVVPIPTLSPGQPLVSCLDGGIGRAQKETGQKPAAMPHGHPAGFRGGRQSLGAGMFWDLSKG